MANILCTHLISSNYVSMDNMAILYVLHNEKQVAIILRVKYAKLFTHFMHRDDKQEMYTCRKVYNKHP